MGRLRTALAWLQGHRWAVVTLQVTALAIVLVFFYWAFRDAWQEAKPLLREADVGDVVISSLILAAYYLLFTVAWQRMLAAWGLEIPYLVALQAEMASILAKYVPGTVWIPAARIAALRRYGIRETPLVLGSMLMEAGLSALSGVIVFLVSLTTVGFSSAPVLPLLLLGLIAAVGLHPEDLHARYPTLAAAVRRRRPPAPPLFDDGRAARRTTASRGSSEARRSTSCFARSAALRRSRTSRISAVWPRSRRSWRFSR